ncbi:hypothetical protein A2917_01820 [Candidatus Nomurabacteria bacterium RIFCSPLOWO2_01_FULL_42_17]|uniref:Uncharacterized protein n=1 Tax=Candidatus Nomurabacteria bacterium RIFCSPLOWO2_01_FULL_42_17 TaxID=1801780 RepID=A0A1F6XLU6_9BACT|nr:MAG: hypothetical protein A2917_01820 [Candidatus Nomurabacteria bacterium RIFCSPLOWO2_01_FULL_42_17]
MISLDRTGLYRLIETKHHTKILYLDDDVYAWVEPPNIGEILVTSHNFHKTDSVLSLGHYRLYNVDNELYLHDQTHLELEVGRGRWQGYLLLSGLPNDSKIRGRIIPTGEVISGNPKFALKEYALL